jgi:hypothetical protein
MFFELVSSFFELGSGRALADAVIHSINKKPDEEEKKPINKVSHTAVAHIRVTVNASISFLL